jgi:hypothetical protein
VAGGWGCGVVVVMEVLLLWINCMTKSRAPHHQWQYSLCSHLLERWIAGMYYIVVLLNNDILLQHVSLRITFFHVSSS